MNLNRFLIKSTEELRQLREAEKTEPASVPIRYLMALDNYRMKGFRQAIGHFKSTLELDPNFAVATYYLGLAQVALQPEVGQIRVGHRVVTNAHEHRIVPGRQLY